jgi:hypothetical protein
MDKGHRKPLKKNIFILVFFGVVFSYFIVPVSCLGAYRLTSPAVPVTAKVFPAPFIAVKVKTLAGADGGLSSLSWPTQVTGSSWQGAANCLELTYATTGAMLVQIYTNNVTTGPCLGVTFSTGTNTCVPVGWTVSDTPITPSYFGEPGDTTADNAVTHYPTGTVYVPWHRLQDYNDGTWQTTPISLLSGTSIILSSADNLQMFSPVYVYFEANFSYANAGETYSTTIYVDLISQ